MVGLEPAGVSEYIKGQSLTTDKVERIESAVRDIVQVWSIHPVRVDRNGLDGFKRAIQIADEILGGERQAENDRIVAEIEAYVKSAEAGLSHALSRK